MSFDMNSGYCGWSMSRRAVEAYDQGGMPKSKWTKKVMLEALRQTAEDEDLPWYSSIEKMKKDEIWDKFFECKSWHHCSKFCNEVDFYGVDEDALKKHLEERRHFEKMWPWKDYDECKKLREFAECVERRVSHLAADNYAKLNPETKFKPVETLRGMVRFSCPLRWLWDSRLNKPMALPVIDTWKCNSFEHRDAWGAYEQSSKIINMIVGHEYNGYDRLPPSLRQWDYKHYIESMYLDRWTGAVKFCEWEDISIDYEFDGLGLS